MIIVKAPEKVNLITTEQPTIFLAGSIDMGNAVDWQTQVQEALKDEHCTIFNPRRDDWDSSWVQDISNPQFKQQVDWELNSIDHADLVIFYFDPKGQSPITLLELGFVAGKFSVRPDQQAVVCCPEGFWRRGNVQIVCDREEIPFCDTIEELIGYTKLYLRD